MGEVFPKACRCWRKSKAQPPFKGAEIEAEKASLVLNKFMHKILRTFDQIADVDQYLLSIDDNIETGQAMPPELPGDDAAGATHAAQRSGTARAANAMKAKDYFVQQFRENTQLRTSLLAYLDEYRENILKELVGTSTT